LKWWAVSEAHAVGSHGSGVRWHRRAGVQTELSFPRQVQVFCLLLTMFVAPLRPTSVTLLRCRAGVTACWWGCFAVTLKTIRRASYLASGTHSTVCPFPRAIQPHMHCAHIHAECCIYYEYCILLLFSKLYVVSTSSCAH
jgi:hypothetical protein